MTTQLKQYIRYLLSLITSFVLLFTIVSVQAQDTTPSFETETGYITRVLELTYGMAVADVGAGDGKYSVFLSDQVGATGVVFSTEVEQEKVNTIKDNLGERQNVKIILGKHESTELPEQCCDRILLRRVYHHFHHPAPMLKSLFTSLKPGGVIAIVDFLRDSGDVQRSDATPDDHEHGVRTHHLIEEMEMVGFDMVRQVEDWPSRIDHGKATDFCILFRRPG